MTWPHFFQNAAKYAPLATAFVALCAAIIALVAMFLQRDVARRRAAIDFFLKTEMDKDVVELYDRFKKISVPALRSIPMPTKLGLQEYKDARSFLNVCELIAVGVNHGAFSNTVARAYWGDVLPTSYSKMRAFIRDIRNGSDDGGKDTYIDLERLCDRWASRG